MGRHDDVRGLPMTGVLLMRIAVAGLEQTKRAAADEIERVGDDRIEPIFRCGKLDNRTLGRRKVDGLRAIVAGVIGGEDDTLFDHGVEDRPHDME